MTPPIDPEAPNPFAHLAFLTPEELLQRRIELTQTIKTAEAERTAIDQELTGAYGDAELRRGARAPGGWVLRSRSRTSWDGLSTYLVATQEST